MTSGRLHKLKGSDTLGSNLADGSQLFNNQPADRSEHTGLTGIADGVKQAGANLWSDVYEHRTAIGVAAGTAAAGALALYAGREQVGRLLAGGAKDVLLVEDTPFMGKAMKSALEQNGERVTWVTGFKSANPLTATTLSGDEMVLNPRNFKVALVDGELKGSYLQGEHVVDALHRAGVTSIGTSTVAKINEAMLANGADLAAQKGTVIGALANNQLDLAGAVRTPATVQKGLDALAVKLKGEAGKPLRKKADDLLGKFMLEEPT